MSGGPEHAILKDTTAAFFGQPVEVSGPALALLVLLLVASATDLAWGKIYNWLTFPFLLAGLVFRISTGGWVSLSEALLAVVVAFGLFFPLYLVRAIAAGDAKLLMAIAAWSDSATVIQLAGIAILLGAAVGLFSLLRQKGFLGSAKSIVDNVRQNEPTATALKMPFGPAFFCAYLVVSVAQYRHWELL